MTEEETQLKVVLPNPNEEAEPDADTLPAPRPQLIAKTISAPPQIPQPQDLPGVLAKASLQREVPRLAKPSLNALTLEPASIQDTQPVEVAESIELRSLLSLRNPETRKELAAAVGNHPAQEIAVKRGLLWLARHQNPDGSWSLHEFHANCKKHGGKCSGAGTERSNTAATGFALLPFLASGFTPGSKEYGQVVTNGVDWLIKNQHEDGKLQGPSDSQVMYSHGIATIALCEAFAMTQDDRTGEAAKKAVNFIVKAQHQPSGGWRYNPNQPGDTSVVGWQVMALKSAEMAGSPSPMQPT